MPCPAASRIRAACAAAVRGQNRCYAQLVCADQPLARMLAGAASVGVDLGVGHLAYVGEHAAGLCPFAPGRPDQRRRLRRFDRQRRANNPEQDFPDGRIKPQTGRRWKLSRRMRRTQAWLADLYRREAARRCEHGHLAHRRGGGGEQEGLWRAAEEGVVGAGARLSLWPDAATRPAPPTWAAPRLRQPAPGGGAASNRWHGAEQLLRAAWSLHPSATPRRFAAGAPAYAGQSGSRAQPALLALS